MTYRFEQRNQQGQVVYQRREEAKGGVTIWDEVLSPGVFIWALFFLGSLGLGFVLVSAAKVPTNNDILTMLGIAAGVSSVSSLLAWGLLWDSYQLRVWSNEEIEYDIGEQPQANNIWQQTGPRTIHKTRVKWTRLQLADLALRCFDANGEWRESSDVARRQLEGIMPNIERKYRTVLQDFSDLGWIIEVADSRYRWTSRGKAAIWRFYPPSPNP